MKTLIIGRGQVGSALYDVVKDTHDAVIRDVQEVEVDGVEVLHICYPDHDGFEQTTKAYIKKYEPRLTIINSSVAVGTTEKCGERVLYSPVRGRHPKLAKDLKIYTKFIFGRNQIDRDLAGIYFRKCGIKVVMERDVNAGEVLKLLSNVHMGVEIAWRQEVERILESFAVSPSIYQSWENSYNQGYVESGDNHLIRPLMKPDPIGGHCILPCIDILSSQYPSKLFDFVRNSDLKARQEMAQKFGQLREIA